MTAIRLMLCLLLLPGTVPFLGQARLPDTQQPPRRIVSLVRAVTEMLFAIGAGGQVVAVSSYDTFPPEATTRPRVGALLDPDVERILSLAPDLVVTYGSQTDLRRQMARASIPTYDYRHSGLVDVWATLRDLGRVTGHMAEAEAVVRDIERQLGDITSRVARRAPPKTALVFGRQPGALRNVYVSGGRGFLHDMLVAAGGVNAFDDLAQESAQVSTEILLARRPDVIIELHEGPELTPDQVRAWTTGWSTLAAIPAVARGRVHVLGGSGLVVPGPRVATAVERLARALHPEAFVR